MILFNKYYIKSNIIILLSQLFLDNDNKEKLKKLMDFIVSASKRATVILSQQ